jgi:uncharacterized circularly permuted ATP-grasp superfamily protein
LRRGGFLDPLTFRPDSALSVAGLMGAYHAGIGALGEARFTFISG